MTDRQDLLKAVRRVALCGAICGTAACAAIPTIEVDNEAGASVGLHIDRDRGTLGWQDKVVILHPGDRRAFRAGVGLLDDGVVTLKVAGCDYRYEPPRYDLPADFQPAHLAAVLVRLGDDGAPYLVPVAHSPRNANGERQFQTLEAHALRHVSKACEPATPPS